jgi:hypothetical protein
MNSSRFEILHFAVGSRLRTIGSSAFYRIGLWTVFIPSSIETIVSDCFWLVHSLIELRFERHSRLSSIPSVLITLTQLDTICIPVSVVSIDTMSGFVQLKTISV